MKLRSGHTPIFLAGVCLVIASAIILQLFSVENIAGPMWIQMVMVGFALLLLGVSVLMFCIFTMSIVVEPGLLRQTGIMGWEIKGNDVVSMSIEYDQEKEYSGIKVVSKTGKTYLLSTYHCPKEKAQGVISIFYLANQPLTGSP